MPAVARPEVAWPYGVLAVAAWATTLASGIHPTISAVALGLLVPARPLYSPDEVARSGRSLLDSLHGADEAKQEALLGDLEELAASSEAPADRMATALRPVVSYLVLPLFALAVAGTPVSAQAFQRALDQPEALGVVAGLLVGKPLGVFGFTWLSVRLGLAQLPNRLTWSHIFGASLLTGIGFTVSFFIAPLAFEGPALESVKLAVLVASTIAAVSGALVLRVSGRR